jgi:IS5 family transposase
MFICLNWSYGRLLVDSADKLSPFFKRNQQSDLGAEEALFETSFYRAFVGISGAERIPDRVSILCFRHLLEEH